MFHNLFLSIEIPPLFALIVYMVISKDIFYQFYVFVVKKGCNIIVRIYFGLFEYKTIRKNRMVDTFLKKNLGDPFHPNPQG